MLTQGHNRFALLALLVLGGCAPTNPSIDIQGLVPPDPTMCSYMPGNVFVVEPILDTSSSTLALRPFGVRYRASFQVANNIINQFNGSYPLMADPNVFQVAGANVELRDIAGNPFDFGGALPNPFFVNGAGFVPSADDDQPGLGIATIEVVPNVYGQQFLDQDLTILVSVEITGATAGGSEQTTGEYVFPLRLCNQCLFMCVLDSTGAPTNAGSCIPGQDAVSALATLCP